MSERMKGSIEVITGIGATATSHGLVVAAATVALVPTLVEAVHGIEGLAPAEPASGQIAAWTATDSQMRPVQIILWPEPDHHQTLAGRIGEEIRAAEARQAEVKA